MKVSEAIALAGRWVEETGSGFPGFRGAYLAGSINEMAKEDPFPPFKDIDIYLVVEDPAAVAIPQKKFLHEGLLLEWVCQSLQEHLSAEAVLSSANAGNVAHCEILSDPTGLLASLRATVAADYALPKWITARCEQQRYLLSNTLATPDAHPDPVFVLGFTVLFLGGVVALSSLRTPTVRRCLALSEELLREHGRPDLQEDLLEVLGSARMAREEVIGHLEECVRAFDKAVEVITTPFYTSWNLDAGTRRYLIDGAYEMIDAGSHREAMFWISMMRSVSHAAIQNDAPEADKGPDRAGMERLRTAIGIPTDAEWKLRVELAKAISDKVFRFADEQIAQSK
jgi:hypothetical protein